MRTEASALTNVLNLTNTSAREKISPQSGNRAIMDCVAAVNTSTETINNDKTSILLDLAEGAGKNARLSPSRPVWKKNWIKQSLVCVMGSMVANTVAEGVTGRSQRAMVSSDHMLTAVNRTLTFVPDWRMNTPQELMSEMADAREKTDQVELPGDQLAYRRQKRINKRQTYRHRIPEMITGKFNIIRLEYLKEYIASPNDQSDRHELIEKAKKLKPGESINITDTVNDSDGTEFTCVFTLYAVLTKTTSGWWPFNSESETKTVYIKPLFGSDNSPIELKY